MTTPTTKPMPSDTQLRPPRRAGTQPGRPSGPAGRPGRVPVDPVGRRDGVGDGEVGGVRAVEGEPAADGGAGAELEGVGGDGGVAVDAGVERNGRRRPAARCRRPGR